MTITLTPTDGSPISLHDNLVWADKHAWTPVAQTTAYSLTGALIVESATRQAGRPITLEGGRNWCWVTLTELESLRAALIDPSAQFTLVLHNGDEWTVIPRHDGDGPISAAPVPAVLDSGLADPVATTKYALNAVRFWALQTEPTA